LFPHDNYSTCITLNPLVKIQAAVRRRGADALLVSQPENRRYLSGYTATDHAIAESAGFLLVPGRGTPLLLTDSRYLLQAEREAIGFDVLLLQSTFPAGLKAAFRRLGLRRLLFEGHAMLYDTTLKLQKMGQTQGIEMVPAGGVVERLRLKKSPAEIEKIKRAVLLNETVFQAVYREMQPGQTEREIALAIETTMIQKGAEAAAFPTIVASGPNAALPHAVPSDRKLRSGETVIIDMGLKLEGYCSDMTRTVVFGKPDKRTVAMLRLVRRAQQAALDALRAGILARDADRASREVIAEAGYGKNFGHGLGHGVGLAVHEPPSLNRLRRSRLQSGMVVTVEPGVYLPGWGGVRLENMVVVEEKGCTVLNEDTTFLGI
jgi:Xaa-Pro aminopeptidase